MPYVFISDGAPEAEEYASNYVWYDPDCADSLQHAIDEVTRRCGTGGVTRRLLAEVLACARRGRRGEHASAG